MAANSIINGDSIYGSYYSGVSSSTGITVVGRTKTYQTYQEMLDDKNPGKYGYVIDASGDSTVESGYAYYINEDGIWKKLFEEEAMDISVGHTHTNMEVLNMIGIKDRRPTFGTDYLVLYREMEKAIAKAIATIVDPESFDPDEIPFAMKSDVERIEKKFKYEFITEEKSAFELEDKTYIIRNVDLIARLPNGDNVPDDVAIRIIVDDNGDECRGALIPHINDTINGEVGYEIPSSVDIRIVYDRANRDWVVIGTVD